MRKERLTADEVREFAPAIDKPMVCECDDGYYIGSMSKIEIVGIYKNRFSFIDSEDVMYTHDKEHLKHYPSQRPEKKEVKPLTREWLKGIFYYGTYTPHFIISEIEKGGFLAPSEPKPKELTVVEAAAVIGKGGKVKSREGFEYPDENMRIIISEKSEPYTEVIEGE